ncbi:MAG: hypothetical protein QM765_33970 [Myxococcales bacterium]
MSAAIVERAARPPGLGASTRRAGIGRQSGVSGTGVVTSTRIVIETRIVSRSLGVARFPTILKVGVTNCLARIDRPAGVPGWRGRERRSPGTRESGCDDAENGPSARAR